MTSDTSKILLEFIKERRSVRTYTDSPIPPEMINTLIESAIWAPSSCNRQPWFFVVVTEKELKVKLASAAGGQKTIVNAPVVIVISINLTPYKGVLENNVAPFIDAGVALENILLTAHSLELGACPVAGSLQEDIIRDALGIPQNYKIMALVALGIPQKLPTPPEREAVDKYYSLNYFDNQGEKEGKYARISLERKRLSRLGGDVSTYYQWPAEKIDLFGYVKNKVLRMISDKSSVLFTYSGMGYFLEGMPSKVSCLVSSKDEEWFIKEFKGLKYSLIVGSPLELSMMSTNYDCVVSFFDLHFMDDREIKVFVENNKGILKENGEFILIFFNRHSWYGLNFLLGNRLNAILSRIRPSGIETPLHIKAVISKVLQHSFSLSRLETGAFVPIPNIAYMFPLPLLIPHRFFDRLDTLRQIPFIRMFGNICFLTMKRGIISK